MLVVLDCNVLVSAGLTDGTCRAVIREVVARHRCVLSQEILAEYREVSARPKFTGSHSQVSAGKAITGRVDRLAHIPVGLALPVGERIRGGTE